MKSKHAVCVRGVTLPAIQLDVMDKRLTILETMNAEIGARLMRAKVKRYRQSVVPDGCGFATFGDNTLLPESAIECKV